MSDIDTLHPLELDTPRLSVENPQTRYDKQGERPDEERVTAAMQRFAKDFGRTAATYMESCIHCGQCAQACHFYTSTQNPKYTPIWKLEPFKQAYKRESGAFSFIYKALNLKHKVTIEELEEWQTLLYDSCTMCGRCSLICPMGIDIATLVGQARHGMFAAGLVPHELWAVAERAEREGSPLGATAKVLKERIDWLADENEIEIPMDKSQADVLIALSSIEIMKYPQSIVSTAKVLNHLGLSWTLRSDGYEATNFGLLSGNSEWQKDLSMKLIQAAIDCSAKLVIMPECGHAYGALRWQGANMYGKPLPFQVLHISEFLAEKVQSGEIKLKALGKSITFHDPCQISRRGGATQAPRDVIHALGADLKETQDTGDLNWCCGGGGGVVTIHRADPLRHKAFEIKMQQIDAAGADIAVTSCSNCRQTFDDGQAHFQWDKTMHSLLELVADNLIE
ncbi:(Fe-S)-binding protein [Sulfuriferula thiophila]|uniref:(Fe-S)-binding protein n=1 Tax=Sulfuriferula thiophila TaxID=1781211 RepID=UPI000F610C79|nr:(Fe-S)-binding protein [Sulfuriferula thiophila]